jgi:hypothetical protein
MIEYPWMKNFNKKQIQEINFSTVYSNGFNHGTSNHNDMIIIAKMAQMLKDIHFAMGGPFPDVDKVKEIMGQK